MSLLKILGDEINLSHLNQLPEYSYEYSGELKALQIKAFNQEVVKKVIADSEKAYEGYRRVTAFERSEILFELSRLLHEHREVMARIISLEAKKPIKLARAEVDRTVATLKFSGIEASKLEGETIPLDAAPNGAGRETLVKPEPVGIVYAVTPFNFPLNLAMHKIGPALAAGNTIIVKPSEKTPFSTLFMNTLFKKSSLPENVVQVVTGDGKEITDYVLQQEEIKKISFTGSVPVGKLIKSKVGLKKLTLELGSTSPVYIDDVEESLLDEIASKVINGAFSYNGQVCISTQKVYIHENIYESFVGSMIEKAEALKYGHPLEENVDYTDLIDKNSQERILSWIEEAVNTGAKLLTGGKKIKGGVTPTLITNVGEQMKLCTQEVFGPVLVVRKIKKEENIVKLLNSSDNGLNAGIFSNDMKFVMNAANELDYGQVLINDVPTLRFDNMPYSGRKNSGYGVEGVKYAVREMMQSKMISYNYK
ncbi:aldehyde dehydrogenase family protein [Corticicoccus populi]|uniref:Aldehyde dehydrogenase family protein n=1 Tax=Corticicoccus populi TaxID=1812821 RepID=A0ABW5WZ60_9STAP